MAVIDVNNLWTLPKRSLEAETGCIPDINIASPTLSNETSHFSEIRGMRSVKAAKFQQKSNI